MSHERHIPNSTTSGKISPRMGNKITTSGEATSGEFCYPQVGIFCHEWWNWNVPWVTNRWFYPSPLLLMMWLTFLYSESENILISPVDFKKLIKLLLLLEICLLYMIGNHVQLVYMLAVRDCQSRTANLLYSKRTMIYMLAVRDWQSCTANVLWFIC